MPLIALKPMLKWAGGKRWLISRLQEYWLPYRQNRLVEPFVGGMAVALGLQPKSALLNDVNPHLINFYTQVQKGLTIDMVMENTADFYYKQRSHFNTLIQQDNSQTPKAAQLFYYLNRTTYNGLSRFNMRGEFNAPFGQYKTINYQKDFLDYISILKNWQFCCQDFSKLTLQKEDFIYADPPYDVEFTQYSADGFRWEDQERLVAWLLKHSGPIVLSNQATSRVLELYQDAGFAIQFLEAPRRIACNGDRTPAKEVLATKNLPSLQIAQTTGWSEAI